MCGLHSAARATEGEKSDKVKSDKTSGEKETPPHTLNL